MTNAGQIKDAAFVRILTSIDTWMNNGSESDRAADFRGTPNSDISVIMRSRCDAISALAAFNGSRRSLTVESPAYYTFSCEEALGAGGAFADTPAVPPWPEEYNSAHHEIVSAQDAVSILLARTYASDSSRVRIEDEELILIRIATLLSRSDAHEKFRKSATYRFRRMFDSGPGERAKWIVVAKSAKILLEDPAVLTSIRRLYGDKTSRPEWQQLMEELGIPENARSSFQ